jgi:hypothetical protein
MPCPDEATLLEFARGLAPEGPARAVEEHLDLCAECRALVAEAAQEGGEPAAPELDAAAGFPRIGRYAVLELISAGGMGVVYRAYDPELDRRVALKLLRPETFGGESAGVAQARLLAEAQALARLSHPNVVAVYDAGTVGAQVFLAMELVEGGTATEWLARAPRRWDEVLQVFEQAGRGLAAAHAARLLHRDFKPENMLVGRDGRVRVTDFGLARPLPVDAWSLPPPHTGEATPFEDVAFSGTPAYMAPELFRREPMDARSDQFSFCVALWEALFGERPFGDGDLGAQIAAKVAGALGPPRDPRRAPDWVRAALERGLSPQPHDRFPFLEDLLSALSRRARARWLWRRVAAAGLALAAAIAVGAGQLLGASAARCRPQGAELEGAWGPKARSEVRAAFGEGTAAGLEPFAAAWLAAREEACRAAQHGGEREQRAFHLRLRCLEGRRDELRALVEALPRTEARDAVADALDGLEPPALCLDHPGVPGAEMGGAGGALARAKVQSALGEPGAALAAAAWAAQAARDAPSVRAQAEHLAGAAALALGRDAEAERDFTAAALSAEGAGDPATAARAWIGLARVALGAGRHEEAQRHARHARAFADASGLARLQAEAAEALADVALRRGELADAQREVRRALALREEHGGRLAVAADLFVLGKALLGARDPAALEVAERAWLAARAGFGAQSPRAAPALCLVADARALAGRRAEAQAAYEQCATAIDPPARAADAQANAARQALLDGRPSDSLALWRRARERLEAGSSAELSARAPLLAGQAEASCACGERGEAQALFAQALRAAGAGFARALVRVSQARCQMGAGERAQARRSLEEALPVLEERGEPTARGDARLLLARVLARDDPGRARGLARAARSDFERAADRERCEEVDRLLEAGPLVDAASAPRTAPRR